MNYRLVIYSKKEDGDLLHQSFRDLWSDIRLDVDSFKQLHGLDYPDAVWSAYDLVLRKWVHWKEKV